MGFHSPLIRPAIYWGGSFGGGTLDSHDVWYVYLRTKVVNQLTELEHTPKRNLYQQAILAGIPDS